jgi:hypothetical protein
MAVRSTWHASLLLTVLLLLSIGGQSVASVVESDCHCDSYDCCHHCEARAGCQTVALPAEVSVSMLGSTEMDAVVSRATELPVVLGQRFIPPKR